MRSEQKTEGQPTLRGHQLKTRSPMDLRAGLLSAGGRRESDKGIARRHADRPDQLLDFLANTFRVLLTAAAYVLMQEMRLRLARTRHARSQVATLREHFLKLGAQVVATVRRIVVHLPQAFPYRDSFHRLALSLGAQSG